LPEIIITGIHIEVRNAYLVLVLYGDNSYGNPSKNLKLVGVTG
jgi:hypothetical protein